MELATDIMAILGWALFGFTIPTHLAVFRNGEAVFGSGYQQAEMTYWTYSALSFGLIAASIVLG